jgi:photosystem I P700 chlorophyll a apoprotein A1
LAIAVLFIVAGHIYRTNFGIGHSMCEILESHRGPFTGQGHLGLYEILTCSWHAQLSLNLAILGSVSIIVAHHIYSIPPYPYLAIDYRTQLSLFTHHIWIGGFCIVGAGAHRSAFILRDFGRLSPVRNRYLAERPGATRAEREDEDEEESRVMVWPRLRYGVHVGSGYLDVANKQWVVATTPDGVGNLFDRIICHRNRIISHLNWVCVFLGFHSFGLYIHNDTISALGRPQDMFRDTAIQLQPVFAQWIQKTHYRAPQFTAPSESSATSIVWGGDFLVVGGKVAIIPIVLGTSDFIVHHIHAFTIHVTVLILLKGCLYARNSGLKRRKRKLRGGFRFPCDGPGRGGTCQISAWDSVFLGLFWIYNSLSIVIFNFSWKIQSDVWGSSTGRNVSHITGGNFRQSANTINGWLRDFLWAQSSQVIQSYGSSLSAYGLIFLGAHFVWAFSLIFLFSGRGYWQELIESIVWAHNKLKLVPFAPPFALSIVQGRAVGVAHFLLGGIATTWSFFLARLISVGLNT